MAFRIRQHPRIRNKPLSCRNGKHKWTTVLVAGLPYLVCEKCGCNVFKDVHDHTYSPGTEKKMVRPHVEAIEQRRLLLKKKILEALDPHDRIKTRHP